MSHPQGDVTLRAKDAAYTLRYSIDAICRLEEMTGKGLVEIAEELQDVRTLRVSRVREVLFVGLTEHHPQVTLKQAGELITQAGGVVEVMAAVNAAMTSAFPQPVAGAAANPRKRAGK